MDIQKELIAEYDAEVARTRKILEAIPAGADFTWKPHGKSMALGRLAGHVSETAGDWAIHTLKTNKLEFPADHKFEPYIPASSAADFKIAGWDENWKFVFGGQAWIDDTKYKVWRNWVINHLVHHRAQLGVYIRTLGGKLPGTYGPSADES
jgi:uncharacterized damage-inducible protein DinB